MSYSLGLLILSCVVAGLQFSHFLNLLPVVFHINELLGFEIALGAEPHTLLHVKPVP